MMLRAALLATGLAGVLNAAPPAMELPAPQAVQLGGLWGAALQASEAGRLSHFVVDEASPAIRLFSADGRKGNAAGRYWGEHAGKWLFAAARGANRTGDPALAARVQRVADYLVSQQDANGYLGTYPEKLRFYLPHQADPKREWDVWTLSCVMLGLLETNKYFPKASYLDASRHIADLMIATFGKPGIGVLDCGNHHGLSATILIDPAAELYLATGAPRYLALAQQALAAAEAEPQDKLVTAGLAGADIQKIDDGKIYQIVWNLVGLAKLYRATGEARYLELLQNDWQSIRNSHLTLEGGPWGGIGVPREEFDPESFFSPDGLVETCSTLSWIQLNRELFAATGQPRYAEEIERSGYNALLGAQDPNGEDWCYYTFPNGQRTNTGYWSCCKSSGAMALEELSPVAYSLAHDRRDVAVNLYGPSSTRLTTAAGPVALTQTTRYPYDGAIVLTIAAAPGDPFTLLLRIPAWATEAQVLVNGVKTPEVPKPGSYLSLHRAWKAGDQVSLNLPMKPVAHLATNRSLHGVYGLGNEHATELEVIHADYVGLTYGPLALATGPVDGFKHAEMIRFSPAQAASALKAASPGSDGSPVVAFSVPGRETISFVPYFAAGGRVNGSWHLTWLQYAAE